MGTSSSSGGPTDNSPLLPPWADPLPPFDDLPLDGVPSPDIGTQPYVDAAPNSPASDQIPQSGPASWTSAKGALSRLARGTSSASFAPSFRKYVGARGGSRAAAHTAFSGRAVTGAFGGFLANVVRDGIGEAADALGLRDVLGRDAEFVLATFIDLLSPDGALLEDAATRKALIETTFEMFDRFNVQERGIEALNDLDAEGMKEIVCLYVTNYIYERFLMEMANCIERGLLSEADANALTDQGKEFVEGEVRFDLSEVDVLELDWSGQEGNDFVRTIYERAYFLLGVVK
ncbi:MAG TPA: Qat anti-phage system associated protein QatB [Anaerolineales bacterium]|nr:Qat anti-phage system associated protein QatB [Anaerolineales bacterium]